MLRALSRPTIDHRGPEFAALTAKVLAQLKRVFQTGQPVIVYPSSGTGAWEAALANCLSPGDLVLAFETGHFATLWRDMATRLGLQVDFVPGDWRHGVDPQVVGERLAADRAHAIAAVAVVHNETSTGVRSRIPEIRAAMDRAGHPALLLADTVSSLACMDYRHDEWGVDVAVGASQKGLMLPPGLGFNVVSEKALAAAGRAAMPRSYWNWGPVLAANQQGFYPYTPATNMFFGLSEALDLIEEEGLARVLARHDRLAGATRAAVRAWGLEVVCADPREYSSSVTWRPAAGRGRRRSRQPGDPGPVRHLPRHRPRQAGRPGVQDRPSGSPERGDAGGRPRAGSSSACRRRACRSSPAA